MSWALGAAALSAAALFSTAASAGTITIGGPGDANSGNCFPFGCTTWAPQYQQVYGSSNFSGTITIKDLVFYNNNLPGGSLNTGTYTIDLSQTSAAVDGLNLTNLSSNIGGHDVTVFSGSLPALAGGMLTIALSTPYTYNPADGNLLLDINGSGLTGGGIYLDADNGSAGGVFSRAMTPGCCTGTSDWGLVTGFTIGGGVPEPATWAAMLLGLGMVGAGLRTARRNDRALAAV